MGEADTKKTIEELKSHNEYLEKTVSEYATRLEKIDKQLIKEAAECKKMEKQKQELLDNTCLRVKELNCLYGLSELVEKYNDSLEDIFNGVVYLIPPAWQHPEVTSARIMFEDKEFKIDDFEITAWMQSAEIKVEGEKVGAVEACLLEERPVMGEGPFLIEEKKLLHVIAERLGRIIERKQTREALVHARKIAEDNYNKLKELEGLKDSLTHMIVHDLNNPLNVVSGNIELLEMQLQDKCTDEQKAYLNKSLTAANELKSMISNLLDINKMEEGKLKLECVDFNLGDVVRETVDQMKVVAERDEKTLSSAVPDNLPLISADSDLIKRVIANLINNALKFTPPQGSVDVKVEYKDSEKSFYIYVKDTGSGIPKEYLGKVFDKFVQVKSKEAKSGRGLGLTFCKMTVETHGGKIRVESEVGKGSTFIFILPEKR